MVAVVWKSKENADYNRGFVYQRPRSFQSEGRRYTSYFGKEGGNQEWCFFFLGLYIHIIFTRGGRNLSIHLSLEVFTTNLPALYRHLYRYLEIASWFQNQNCLCSLVQRRASQLQQNCRLRDPHPPTSHAGLVRATLRVSAWHHATQPKCVVSLELSISSCLDSLHPHPKLLVAFYNESMEQVLTKWTVGYTWSRVPPSFPGSFCQVLDNPGWWYKATHLAGQHPSYENAECSQWT